MKRICLIMLSICMHGNLTISQTNSVDIQKEAVDIIASISENLANLIIHHKKTSDPEITKQHSIDLIKSITQAITLCIAKAQAQRNSKSIMLYDQATLNAMIKQIAQSITNRVQETELGNI